MINLDILRTFVAVVEHGSVIGASRTCGFTPAAISRQMSAFQKRLGVRLFEPDGRGIRVTPLAADLASDAHALLEQSARFEKHVHALCHDHRSIKIVADAGDDSSHSTHDVSGRRRSADR